REDEFDFAADFELRFGEKVETLIADIARLRAEFAGARFAGKNAQRKTHGKSPVYAPFRSIGHTTPPIAIADFTRTCLEIMPNGTPRRGREAIRKMADFCPSTKMLPDCATYSCARC